MPESRVTLELPLVGVKLLDSLEGLGDVPRYSGVSYCDAVRLATYGEDLVLEPGCIDVCKWSPVIMGLEEPGGSFGQELRPTVGRSLAGVRVAQLPRLIEQGVRPDVVIARGRASELNTLADAIGGDALQSRYRGDVASSALGGGEGGAGLKALLIKSVNRVLSWLRGWSLFDRMVKKVFSSEAATTTFERIIRAALADMSVCRNSTVIPLLEDAGNISYFCTGGIAWGRNDPSFLTSGWPWAAIEKVYDRLDFPGKPRA